MAKEDQTALSKEADVRRRMRRQRLGCWSIIIIPVALLIFAFVAMSRENAEWVRLQPKDVTAEKWQARREQCRLAELDLEACAATPEREIDKLASQKLADQMAELCAREDDFYARKEAEEAVRASLKAPGTAKFQSNPSIQHDGCNWTISGEVDAENSFGALLRSTYRVKLRRAAKEVWIRLSVSVSN